MPQAYTPRGSDQPCVFCAVVSGEVGADVVHRSERLVAFLDVHPLFPGHVLMVPTHHVQTYDDLPADLASEWMLTAQALQRAVEHVTAAEGALLLVNNVVSQSVPHVHLHVVPRSRGDGLRFFLGPRQEYRPGQAAELASLLRERLAHEPLGGAPLGGAPLGGAPSCGPQDGEQQA